jgi:hypothetical protein
VAVKEMPIIEFNISTRVDRHLAAVRLMSYMAFPDNPELRTAAETAFRAKLAEWYATAFPHRAEEKQKEVLLRIGPKMRDELPRALADPAKWARNWIFNDFLEPVGGIAAGAAVLADAPSASWLVKEWRRRWFAITYTGKLVCLVGSMHQHHELIGPSLKKAVYLLCEMDGKDKRVTAGLRRLGFPAVYESSLKEAWRQFKSVAHLCAAVVSRSWWKSEKASRSGELSHNSRPLGGGCRRMTPWRAIAGVGGKEKARSRS